jgi:hypothetical protein
MRPVKKNDSPLQKYKKTKSDDEKSCHLFCDRLREIASQVSS